MQANEDGALASSERAQTKIVELSGPRTLRNTEQTHSLLAEALSQSSCISVDCSNIPEIDLSFVQLVLAARRAAAESGKSLTLAGPARGALFDALFRGGFLTRRDGPAGGQAFWLKQEASDGENRTDCR
jgi:ABC-type transporter Mla MlaB component